MKRPIDRHLDGDEIDALVNVQMRNVITPEQFSDEAIREAQIHVELCQDCRQKVELHRSVQSEFSRMRGRSEAPAGPDCLDEKELLGLAAGLLPDSQAEKLMKHAAQCDHCGPSLKAAVAALVDEATADEENLMASLPSARPEWQSRLADTLRRAGARQEEGAVPWWKGLFVGPRLVFAAGALVTLVVVGWVGFRVLRPATPEQLLAQAYSEHRTLEVRIPGASYAPMRVERGGGGSNLEKPASLLKAEALIGENLQKNPNDAKWLEAKARADLLDGNYDSAIKTLQRAMETDPDSPQLLSDLGSAYYMRAKSADRAIDYGNAIESLGRALAKTPNDPIALFNRALACEEMFLYTQAVDDWEHYLRVDPNGEWAEEAKKRLAAVREKTKQHERSRLEPLLTPAGIVSANVNSDMQQKVDARIEEYLRVAITDWLPQSFPVPPSHSAPQDSTALAILAMILRERHDDSWLSDLLSRSTAAQFPAGLQALSAALQADDRGDYAAAHASAQQAVQLFRAATNPAGELRAQAEEVYSDHLLWEGHECISLLRTMETPLNQKKYTWIQAQMSLEKSNCANQVADLRTYQSAIGVGAAKAKQCRYPALFLRGLGFQALAEASNGIWDHAFSLAVEGLAAFWSGQVDITKGYNFYSHLGAAADELHLPHLQVAIWREGTTLLDKDPDVLKRAMAHRWYCNAAYLAGMPSVASEEFSKARELFEQAPKTEATARDYLDAEVWLANAELRRGDIPQAAERLKTIRPLLKQAPSFDPEMGYYSAQAEIAMRQDAAETESALRSAIFLAEWGLRSLPSGFDRHQWAEQSRSAYRNLVEWKLRQGDATSALELWEWYRGAEFRAPEASNSSRAQSIDAPTDLEDAPELPQPTAVATALPLLRDETVIAYGAFSNGIAVWVYDDRGIFSRWISISPPQVQDLVTRFERLCSDPISDLSLLKTNGRALYDLVIKPVEDHLLPGRTLLFEPDESLAAIPWEALLDGTGHYLVERATIVVAPGPYETRHLKLTMPITPATPALIVSVPVAPEEGLSPLQDAETEAHTVARMFSSARLLEGKSATLSAIQGEIRGKMVFHFAGHAVASPGRSGLILGERDSDTQHARLLVGGSFSQKELGDLQLAILSGCRTGGVSEGSESGNEGLTEALLGAGVPRVVASRWNVDSSVTAAFMKQFLASLLAGTDAADALRTTRLALASQLATSHPYYWSAFELNGTK